MSFREASILYFLLILLNLLMAYLNRAGHTWWLNLMVAAFIAGVWLTSWVFHRMIRDLIGEIK